MSHLAVTARGRRAEEGMMAGVEGGWEFEWRDRLSKHTWEHANADMRVQMGPQTRTRRHTNNADKTGLKVSNAPHQGRPQTSCH